MELHKALKKILEELEPLETKINQSVRRMRKRLCQEWLNYVERYVSMHNFFIPLFDVFLLPYLRLP